MELCNLKLIFYNLLKNPPPFMGTAKAAPVLTV